MRHGTVFVVAAWALFGLAAPALADGCTGLVNASIPHTTITAATDIPAGQFTTPDQIGYGSVSLTVPAFCRVQLTIGTATSEVWLPVAWNYRLSGWGDGGELGAIIYDELYDAVAYGFVGVSSDLGHQSTGSDASWALNRPDLIREFGRTATHDMTIAAKTLTKLYYGQAPNHSYFIGASAGGRQALMEAQDYPDDYDGIVSVSPGQHWTHLMSGMIEQELDLGGSGTSDAQLSDAQALALNTAVIAACDALDGLADGLIENPQQCHFDPGALLCATTNPRPDCLSPVQIDAVRRLYLPFRLSNGELVYPGLPRGSEYEWSCSVLHNAFNFPFADVWYQDEVWSDPNWDFHTFDPDVDVPYADKLLGETLNGSSPNIDRFIARGGKLVIAQGDSDAIVVPENTIDYYLTLKQRYGARTGKFVRLFMEPGVGHCAPAVGPGSWNIYAVIENWVESETAPDSIVAYQYNSDGTVNRTRPLCPYPTQAKYSGQGDVNDYRNFTCANPPA
jgi:feruloyl esterase